nr:MAG TPA: hypothetical protein [Caudoviricetes sp.]
MTSPISQLGIWAFREKNRPLYETPLFERKPS